MTKDITPLYFKKLWKTFEKWKLGGEKTHVICFHLSELANFAPKYMALLDILVKQPTKEKFLDKLQEIDAILFEKHEVEYHLIPAQELLTSWFKTQEDL